MVDSKGDVEHREGSKTETGKARLSLSEITLIDAARGSIGRGVWLRDAAVRYSSMASPPNIGWPAHLPPDEVRIVDVGFRLTEADVTALNALRGGIPLGTWIRETAVRVAGALQDAALPPDLLKRLTPGLDDAPRRSLKKKPAGKVVPLASGKVTTVRRRPKVKVAEPPAPVPEPVEPG